jgi:hypothetical protein
MKRILDTILTPAIQNDVLAPNFVPINKPIANIPDIKATIDKIYTSIILPPFLFIKIILILFAKEKKVEVSSYNQVSKHF